jgi:hypothetical protein
MTIRILAIELSNTILLLVFNDKIPLKNWWRGLTIFVPCSVCLELKKVESLWSIWWFPSPQWTKTTDCFILGGSMIVQCPTLCYLVLSAQFGLLTICTPRSSGSSDWAVSLPTDYRLNGWRTEVWVPVGTRCVPSPCHPDQFWGSPSLLMGTRGSFPGGKAAGEWSWPLTSN